MINSYSVPLSQMVKEFNLRLLYKATDYDSINITVDDISRPACSWPATSSILSPCACS